MRPLRILARGLPAVLVGAALTPASAAPAAPPAAADSTAVAAGTAHTITLVTGDVVQVSGDGANRTARVVTDVAPRGDVQIINQGEDLYALPGVAAPLLAAGQLDVRLFNLSVLVRDGYTDEKVAQLPVIVDYQVADGSQPPAAPVAGTQVRRRLPAAGAVALGVDKKQGTKFWVAVTEPKRAAGALTLAPQVKKVWLDGKVKATDDVSRVTVSAERAWAAGFDGAGVPVAVLDTGVDADHPDLAGQVVEARNFVPADRPGGDSPTDRYGHGTHVASIVAGTGAKSGGQHAGVAPKATIFSGKVLGDDGYGQDSSIIAGMEWAASKAKVVNMSLGGCCSDGTDPLAQALNEISRRTGALFVTSAGNNGLYGPFYVGTPAVADEALSVAATLRDGSRVDTSYSSAGPRRGDFAIKPEISAPGTGIWAASANNDDNVICTSAPTACDGNGYMRISGTSMAAPHVSAVAAIVRQQHPDWTAQQVRDALTSTATPNTRNTVWQQGAGLVDAGRAVTQKLHATGIVNLGVDTFPSDTQTGTITYTNSGDAPVTLDLTSQFWRPNTSASGYFRGQTAWTPPTGAVQVEPAQVTVPAGSTATATVSIDNTVTPLGTVYGRLTASGPDGVQVRTALSATHDPERHRLAVDVNDMDGNAPDPARSLAIAVGTQPSSLWVHYFDEGEWWTGKWINLNTGEVTDLPADTYRVSGSVATLLDRTAVFAGWTVPLDQDRALTIDTRPAKEVRIRTERPSVDESTTFTYHDAGVRYTVGFGGGSRLFQLLGPQPDGVSASYASVRVPQPLTLRSPDGRVRVPAFLPQDWISIYTLSGGVGFACFSCRVELPTDGRITMVDAGDGGPAALAGKDLRGKVALIREKPRTAGEDELSRALVDAEIRAVTEAGAVGVVLAVDAGSPFRYAAWDHKIWATVVSTADGAALAKLVRHRPATLTADSNAPASYDYQITSGPAPVLADPVYEVDQDGLAAVTTRFHASYPGQPAVDLVWFGSDFVRVQAGTLPLVRTEYVMPGAEQISSGHCAITRQLPYPAACMWGVEGFRPALRAGERFTRDLMKAPMVPQRTLDRPFAQNNGGTISWDHGLDHGGDSVPVPHLGAGDGAGGMVVSDGAGNVGNKFTNRTRIYRGDEQVCDTPTFLSSMVQGCVVREPGQYRVVVDSAMSTYPLSTRTSTEWSLAWNRDPAAKVPLVMPEYRLPVDLNNSVPAKPHRAPVQIGYQRGGPAAPAQWTVQMWATFDDGATWRPVFDGQVGSDGLVAPTIKPPRHHNGFVGLRIKANDGQGNGIDQTVLRAYYLGRQ